MQNIQGGGGGGMQMFRNFGDGETKSTTYVNDSMVKTVMKNDMGRSTIIRNNNAKLTTTLLEIMGNKTGFFITDDEQAVMKVKMDSMMQARRNADTTKPKTTTARTEYPVEISYVDGTKKIAGYDCKKVWVITTKILGIKDSVAVWYNPEIKIQTYQADNQRFIEISDNGSGIEPEALEKIFIPFYTTKKTGSGIGLSLSKQIMQMHGGNLKVTSKVGEGSLFLVIFYVIKKATQLRRPFFIIYFYIKPGSSCKIGMLGLEIFCFLIL